MPIPTGTKESFVKKAKEKWGEKYNYSRVNYINSRTSVEVICNKHNVIFEQTPKAHFAAKHECCPICYKEISGSFQNEWRSKKEVVLASNEDYQNVHRILNSLHYSSSQQI